ncbi:phospholipase D-like domain-containing protein, partial [bacterium]|nr:phospholipase D-like domain-containing protein [bacterium]
MPGKTEESRQTIKNSVGRAVLVAISVLLQVFWIVLLVMRLNQYYAYISLATSVLSFLVVLHICGNKINAAYKLSWIVLIQFMPILGLCLFLMFGKESSNAVMRRRFGRIDQQMPRYLPQDEATAARLDAENPGLGNQAHYLRNTAGFPVYGDTRVTFYGDTNEALEAQKAELRKAEHFIFMEYHAIEDSTAWRGLEEILAEKAAAGVDVRVFYDDMGSIGFISKPFARRLQAQGIQCRVFNPLVPVLNVFMNNRDHRKITVVDGQVGFTGGYNLADEYFNLTHPYGQWKDSGLRLEGSAVRSLTVIFLEMWNATQKVQEDPTPFLVPAAVPQGAGGYVIPYADSPLDTIATGEDVYLNILKNAKRYVYLTTPYLIIDDEMQRELTLAARRGVDVRIITPGIPDKKTVF